MFMATQANALWRFNVDFSDLHGTKIGSISWPDVAEATNARVSFKGTYPTGWTKNVEIVFGGAHISNRLRVAELEVEPGRALYLE